MTERFILEGLNCANCAAQIEGELAALPGVEFARVNLIKQELLIRSTAEVNDSLVEQSIRIVHKYEPDVRVMEIQAGGDGEVKHSLIRPILRSGGAMLLLAVVLIWGGQWRADVRLLFFALLYIFVAYDVFWKALKNLVQGRLLDENFLMAVASIGALLIGEYAEGCAVMLFYQVGEFFQDLAVDHSRRSIRSLLDMKKEGVHLLKDGLLQDSSPLSLLPGDLIISYPGEKIPIDASVTEGASSLDLKALNGESLPLNVQKGDRVLSGSINLEAALTLRVEKNYENSTAQKILEMVEDASAHKSREESFITRFARVYTPIVVGLALLLALPPLLFLPIEAATHWLYRALTFLVVSCPCALVISVPLSFFSGIGRASRDGVLVKGSHYLDLLSRVDTLVFDKTGTLTEGRFSLQHCLSMNHDLTSEQVIDLAAHVEAYSNHPLALSIKAANWREPDVRRLGSHRNLPGCGQHTIVDGRSFFMGGERLLESLQIPYSPVADEWKTYSVLYLTNEKELLAVFFLADMLKADSRAALVELREMGITDFSMLSGDRISIAEHIGSELQITKIYAQLLPQDKVNILGKIMANKASGRTAFVGDGINDAAVLALADVGVAMGGLGQDAAISAADLVILDDSLSKLPRVIRIARRTVAIARQNIFFALGIKILVMLLAFAGLANMWAAVFADVGVTLLAILNSLRILILRPNRSKRFI